MAKNHKERQQAKIQETTERLKREDKQRKIQVVKTVFSIKQAWMQIANQQALIKDRLGQIDAKEIREKDEWGNFKTEDRLKIDIEWNYHQIEQEHFHISQWEDDIDKLCSEGADELHQDISEFVNGLKNKGLLSD